MGQPIYQSLPARGPHSQALGLSAQPQPFPIPTTLAQSTQMSFCLRFPAEYVSPRWTWSPALSPSVLGSGPVSLPGFCWSLHRGEDSPSPHQLPADFCCTSFRVWQYTSKPRLRGSPGSHCHADPQDEPRLRGQYLRKPYPRCLTTLTARPSQSQLSPCLQQATLLRTRPSPPLSPTQDSAQGHTEDIALSVKWELCRVHPCVRCNRAPVTKPSSLAPITTQSHWSQAALPGRDTVFLTHQ